MPNHIHTPKWRTEHGSNFIIGLIILAGAIHVLNQVYRADGAVMPVVIGI